MAVVWLFPKGWRRNTFLFDCKNEEGFSLAHFSNGAGSVDALKSTAGAVLGARLASLAQIGELARRLSIDHIYIKICFLEGIRDTITTYGYLVALSLTACIKEIYSVHNKRFLNEQTSKAYPLLTAVNSRRLVFQFLLVYCLKQEIILCGY